MKRTTFVFAVLLLCVATSANDLPKRPRILGIARVHILVTDLAEARSFYTKVLGQARDCNWCERIPGRSLLINELQGISLSAASVPPASNLIEEISFDTDDVPKLRRYLIAHNVAVSEPQEGAKPTGPYFSVIDPGGHRISFIQSLGFTALKPGYPLDSPQASNFHLIHAGIIVRNRAATEHFYKDILGFHPYWHGGMKDDQTDWVSMQVPDGTDWLEFMVNVEPDADQRLRGIMNHIAIGVTDIHATQKKLQENGVELTEEPEIGRDGKWQLNLYDPDDTRVELMEFTPVQKPCCSEYTGPHPKP